MNERPETASNCLGMLDRHTPPHLAAGLTAAERARLVAAGAIALAGPRLLSVKTLKKLKRFNSRWHGHSPSMDAAKAYLALPEVERYGAMTRLAKEKGVSMESVSATLRRLRLRALEAKAA